MKLDFGEFSFGLFVLALYAIFFGAVACGVFAIGYGVYLDFTGGFTEEAAVCCPCKEE